MKYRLRGWTLIELMIVIALIAIILTLAVPGFGRHFDNQRIRNVANSISDGMLVARLHAMKSNTPTSFRLDASGGWSVQEEVVPPNETIDRFNWNDWKSVSVAVSPAGATAITFDGMGRQLKPNADGSPPLARVDVEHVNAAKGVYPLRVEVGQARGIRMCMPHLPSADPKACS